MDKFERHLKQQLKKYTKYQINAANRRDDYTDREEQIIRWERWERAEAVAKVVERILEKYKSLKDIT